MTPTMTQFNLIKYTIRYSYYDQVQTVCAICLASIKYDISKMLRQINIRPEDSNKLRIVWRKNKSDQLEEMRSTGL
ncbi:CLUMA_CG016081, isoform A [Clunio marinus]|uniref:CLUMA_CG016081, isoform A n=1 Tax=Clunio marinus TaxID=568069 RepID=A0A1J1IWG5_9DIPT|nr:CLUMA_CG016081, isoform A [Clunio marinus]